MASSNIKATNLVNDDGNPTGGTVTGMGIDIKWQDGVLGPDRTEHNGALLEDVLEAAIQRLRFFQSAQSGKFACRENSVAITHLEESQQWLWRRARNREERRVLGTYTP